MRNFGTRFEAQVPRFNLHNSGSLSYDLVALMLLAKSNTEDNQRVSIMAATVINVKPINNAEPTAYEMISSVKYASIAYILRQCERERSTVTHGIDGALSANHTHGSGGGYGKYKGKFRQRQTP